MTWDGSWQQDTYTNRAPDLKWDVAIMPASKGKTFVGCLGGWNLVVFKDSRSTRPASSGSSTCRTCRYSRT